MTRSVFAKMGLALVLAITAATVACGPAPGSVPFPSGGPYFGHGPYDGPEMYKGGSK